MFGGYSNINVGLGQKLTAEQHRQVKYMSKMVNAKKTVDAFNDTFYPRPKPLPPEAPPLPPDPGMTGEEPGPVDPPTVPNPGAPKLPDPPAVPAPIATEVPTATETPVPTQADGGAVRRNYLKLLKQYADGGYNFMTPEYADGGLLLRPLTRPTTPGADFLSGRTNPQPLGGSSPSVPYMGGSLPPAAPGGTLTKSSTSSTNPTAAAASLPVKTEAVSTKNVAGTNDITPKPLADGSKKPLPSPKDMTKGGKVPQADRPGVDKVPALLDAPPDGPAEFVVPGDTTKKLDELVRRAGFKGGLEEFVKKHHDYGKVAQRRAADKDKSPLPKEFKKTPVKAANPTTQFGSIISQAPNPPPGPVTDIYRRPIGNMSIMKAAELTNPLSKYNANIQPGTERAANAAAAQAARGEGAVPDWRKSNWHQTVDGPREDPRTFDQRRADAEKQIPRANVPTSRLKSNSPDFAYSPELTKELKDNFNPNIDQIERWHKEQGALTPQVAADLRRTAAPGRNGMLYPTEKQAVRSMLMPDNATPGKDGVLYPTEKQAIESMLKPGQMLYYAPGNPKPFVMQNGADYAGQWNLDARRAEMAQRKQEQAAVSSAEVTRPRPPELASVSAAFDSAINSGNLRHIRNAGNMANAVATDNQLKLAQYAYEENMRARQAAIAQQIYQMNPNATTFKNWAELSGVNPTGYNPGQSLYETSTRAAVDRTQNMAEQAGAKQRLSRILFGRNLDDPDNKGLVDAAASLLKNNQNMSDDELYKAISRVGVNTMSPVITMPGLTGMFPERIYADQHEGGILGTGLTPNPRLFASLPAWQRAYYNLLSPASGNGVPMFDNNGKFAGWGAVNQSGALGSEVNYNQLRNTMGASQ